MPYKEGFDRDQAMILSWGDVVAPDSEARLVDAFVDSLDLEAMGFGSAAAEGRPGHGPRDLLKLYIWGYRRGIRSSRRLAEACRTNVEAIWMLSGLTPDFRTIADFRKAHAAEMRKVFHALDERIAGAVEWGFCSVDGSKVAASNSKLRNLAANKLEDRITWLDAHTKDYLRRLDEIDAMEEPTESDVLTRETIEAKLAEAMERLGRYEGHGAELERSGASQLSLTDADSRLMRGKGGFLVAYNPQTAVDSETHPVRDFLMTNALTDHGQLLATMSRVAAETDGVVEVVADKGYQSASDMAACLEAGILPHAVAGDGVDAYEVELPHEPAEDVDPSSTDPAEISRCLRAGVVPDAYAGTVEAAEARTSKGKVVDDPAPSPEPYGSPEEVVARAKEGYFVRDPGRNLVVCPAGEKLAQKSARRSGAVRYANRVACRRCPHRDRCYRGKQGRREVDFTKDQLEKPCLPWHEAAGTTPDRREIPKGRWHYETRKVVILRIRPDVAKTTLRMGISEHPFGTIKRSMGGGHFLMRGLENVEAEFSLMCLGHDMRRAANLLGFGRLMELMGSFLPLLRAILSAARLPRTEILSQLWLLSC